MRRLLLAIPLVLASPAKAGPFDSSAPAGNGTTVNPSGTSAALSLSAIAGQQGVLLDGFSAPGDADDTASLKRAVSAGVPILLGPRTYIINNFASGAVANFVLHGVNGASIIKRTSASGSHFFNIAAANVDIDGVIFDMNKAGVTANQWGVYLGAGGQNIAISNSVFKNNSGTLGYCLVIKSTGPAAGGSLRLLHDELTGCTANAAYLGSVSNGVVDELYSHDNSATGLYISAYGAASSSNYAADIVVSNSRFLRNATGGVGVGGFSPPYNWSTPPAVRVSVHDSSFVDTADSTHYHLAMQGDYLTAANNIFSESAPTVPLGGIDCNGTHSLIQHNTMNLPGISYGIDCGGSISPVIQNNALTLTSGNAIDVGGTQNALVTGNWVTLSGSGHGADVQNIEADGSGSAFPYPTSGLVIEGNTFVMSGGSTSGINLMDNAGGTEGAVASIIKGNKFVSSGGASDASDINYAGTADSIVIEGNYHNGSQTQFTDPVVDLVFQAVYDEVRTISATTPIRAIIPQQVSTYGAGGSILYVWPISGGSGYVAGTTTLVASGTGGGSGWTGTAQISNGVIVGVHTTNYGSGYAGKISVAATDSSGGAGAVLAVGHIPTLPAYRKLRFIANSAPGNLVQDSGGYVSITGGVAPFFARQNVPYNLEALASGVYWTFQAPASGTAASLPTCNAAANGASSVVTDATSPTYGGALTGGGTIMAPVFCNGTQWVTH